MKPKKCSFFRKEVSYLGHRVTVGGLFPDPARVEKIKTWPVPTDQTEMKRFLGVVNFYGRFIDHGSEVSSCLHEACAGVEFVMDEPRLQAFKALREKLARAPVLAHRTC